jgi:hypothetical protein
MRLLSWLAELKMNTCSLKSQSATKGSYGALDWRGRGGGAIVSIKLSGCIPRIYAFQVRKATIITDFSHVMFAWIVGFFGMVWHDKGWMRGTLLSVRGMTVGDGPAVGKANGLISPVTPNLDVLNSDNLIAGMEQPTTEPIGSQCPKVLGRPSFLAGSPEGGQIFGESIFLKLGYCSSCYNYVIPVTIVTIYWENALRMN